MAVAREKKGEKVKVIGRKYQYLLSEKGEWDN